MRLPAAADADSLLHEHVDELVPLDRPGHGTPQLIPGRRHRADLGQHRRHGGGRRSRHRPAGGHGRVGHRGPTEVLGRQRHRRWGSGRVCKHLGGERGRRRGRTADGRRGRRGGRRHLLLVLQHGHHSGHGALRGTCRARRLGLGAELQLLEDRGHVLGDRGRRSGRGRGGGGRHALELRYQALEHLGGLIALGLLLEPDAQDLRRVVRGGDKAQGGEGCKSRDPSTNGVGPPMLPPLASRFLFW